MIAILLPDLRGGGAERVNLDLASEFLGRGHAVDIVLMQKRGELLSEVPKGARIIDLSAPRLRNVLGPLTRYLKRERPVALLAAMWPLTAIAGFALRLSRHSARLVASEHVDFLSTPSHKEYERWALKCFGRQLYRPCHRVVAVSAGVADSLQEVAGLPPEQVMVIHNPVRRLPPEEMFGDDRNRLAQWLYGEARLIAIGALKRQKGFDVLLRSFADLRQRLDARLLILGEGPLRGELETLAAELRIAESVCLPGFRANPGIFLQHADVFVLSSNWEGFGNVIVEALSIGVPVVSTDCRSGPSEILEGGRYGRLVPVGDVNALASAIENALSSEHDSGALQRRAAEFAPHLAAQKYLSAMGLA